MKRGVATDHSFFDQTDFFWRITLSHPFFHGGWCFTGAVTVMHFFRGYTEPIIFDSSWLLRKATFLEDLIYAFDFLRAVYLFHHSSCHHPTFEVVYLFLSQALVHSLNGTIFTFTGELAVIHCLSNSFSSRYCNYFLEYSQASIILTVLYIFLLKFAAIQLGKHPFLQRNSGHQSLWNKLIIKTAVFPEQNWL